MMGGGMAYGSIVAAIFILGFAYIILVLSNKEEGNIKLAGQVISALIALIAVVALISSLTGWGRGGMMGGCGMMGEKGMMKGSMMQMMKENPKMMDEMCKDPAMKKMMMEKMQKMQKGMK